MEPFHKSAMDIGGCVDLKIAFCGHLEPFGASYDSQSPFRTQKIIPIYCLSYAFTISNLDWRWSTRLEPPNPRMVPRAIFSSFGPYWLPWWPTWPTKLFLCITTDAQWLLPPLFHTVPPDWSHQTHLWPKKDVFDLIGPLMCPLMPLDGPLWPTKLLQSTTPVVPWLVPSPLFQTVSPYCSHKTCLWPIKVIFGGPLIV